MHNTLKDGQLGRTSHNTKARKSAEYQEICLTERINNIIIYMKENVHEYYQNAQKLI